MYASGCTQEPDRATWRPHWVYAQKSRGIFGMGRGFVFFCPHCRKVMGFGTQWYPFPG